MSEQRIFLGAIVASEGRVLLLRDRSGRLALPGGPLLAQHEDVDLAMDAYLAEIGVVAPSIEEDFLETLYLPEGDGPPTVFNLFAASEWRGEPLAPGGMSLQWAEIGALAEAPMDEVVRDAVLIAFGRKEPHDDSAQILSALRGGAAEPRRDPLAASRHGAGLDVLGTLFATDPAEAFANLQRTMPGLAEDIVDFGLGEVWSRPELDRKTRSLQVVAMLAALGRRDALRGHIRGALNHGATVEQLRETLRMVAVYGGFPAAVEAWPVLGEVLAERGLTLPGALE